MIEHTERRYPSASDAHMRLCDTIVRYRRVPVYCSGLPDPDQDDGCFDLQFQYLHGPRKGDFVYICANDEELDVSSAPLGYVKTEYDAVYATRPPTRSQRQGICPPYLRIVSTRTGEISNGAALRNTAIGECIVGDYQPLSSAFFPGERHSTPFARHWAVATTTDGNIWSVHHKGFMIGVYYPDSKTFLFPADSMSPVTRKQLDDVLRRDTLGEYNVICSG